MRQIKAVLLATTFLLPASQAAAQIFQYLPNANLCAATPVTSAANEASHVLKNAQGSICSASVVVNSVSGFMVLINAISVPADGAVTPVFCVPVAANSMTIVNWPTPLFASTGITLFVSQATSCFTKTTTNITAFISGNVQ